MAEVITWIHFGGKFEASSTYVGGDTEILLLNNDVDYSGLKQMVAELLKVDEICSKMHFSFQTRNPAKPIYDIIDDRTIRILISFASQNSLRHSLMVTIEDEWFRSTKGSNDPSDLNKESLNPNSTNVGGLESIPEGTTFRREDDVVGDNLFSDQFGNPDIPGVAVTTGKENVAASDNVS